MRFSPSIFAGFVLFLIIDPLVAQTHLAPLSGSDGVPGTVANSFIVKWASAPGAVDYEYVMSNNRQCFETCPGDTRQQKTGGDTMALEYNLIADRWYYWISRIIYEDGEMSDWSAISNFFTKTPESQGNIVTIAPNPISDNTLNITIDWAVNIGAQYLNMQVYQISGQLIIDGIHIEKQLGRYQNVSIPLFFLSSGTYILKVIVDKEQLMGPKQFNLKMIIP